MSPSTLGHSIKPFLLAMLLIACVPRAGAESLSEPLASEVATDTRSVSSTEQDDARIRRKSRSPDHASNRGWTCRTRETTTTMSKRSS